MPFITNYIQIQNIFTYMSEKPWQKYNNFLKITKHIIKVFLHIPADWKASLRLHKTQVLYIQLKFI